MSTSSPTALVEQFAVDEIRTPNSEANYNVAPRAEVPVIAQSQGQRVLDVVRWGLIPSWAKEMAIGDRMINARADTVATTNAYKRAFERRRCIVPADGFYEWKPITSKRKQPYFIHATDGAPLAFAGIWEIWHDPNAGDDAPRIRSFAIITTDANDTLKELHDRMPVVLPRSAWEVWLDRENRDVDALQQLLVPALNDAVAAYPVSTLVNKADNNGPELLEPVTPDTLFA